MYTAEQTKTIQKETQDFLRMQPEIGVADLEKLREVLRFHEYRYYILDEPLLADYEYDQLYKALERIEKAHPELVIPDSPTQRVANGLTPSFPTVSHLVPMLSLDNSYDAEDLTDWDRRVREGCGEQAVEYSV